MVFLTFSPIVFQGSLLWPCAVGHALQHCRQKGAGQTLLLTPQGQEAQVCGEGWCLFPPCGVQEAGGWGTNGRYFPFHHLIHYFYYHSGMAESDLYQ